MMTVDHQRSLFDVSPSVSRAGRLNTISTLQVPSPTKFELFVKHTYIIRLLLVPNYRHLILKKQFFKRKKEIQMHYTEVICQRYQPQTQMVGRVVGDETRNIYILPYIHGIISRQAYTGHIQRLEIKTWLANLFDLLFFLLEVHCWRLGRQC